jgi:lipoprotein-releasing system permease protein
MYKFLLCWRYLLTRYLALACIISVMLGVATLIVVNSVMAGFSTRLRDRLHGLLSDVLVEATSFEGFPDAEEKLTRIRQDPVLGQKVEAVTATLDVFALLQFRAFGETITRRVQVIGIDPVSRTEVGGFSEYLVNQRNNPRPRFDLDAEAHRRNLMLYPPRPLPVDFRGPPASPGEPPPPKPPPSEIKVPKGIIIGNAIASFRVRDPETGGIVKDRIILRPGDEVFITTVSGAKLAPVMDSFAVCDYFKSEMSEYDANYVFVPLDYFQRLRAMENRATNLLVRLKNYDDAPMVVKRLGAMFPECVVETWEGKQGPLLAAIAVEKGILNVLLFLIIGVAGFGILAIFTMIVVEKTRDIGILKALGASNGGVMQIFLGYGLLLGVVGAVLGTGLGLWVTKYINEIEKLLGRVTGQDIFPRDVYYFDRIPTFINPTSILLVNLGAIAIAVIFSVLPALRAALLHPVRALRYE